MSAPTANGTKPTLSVVMIAHNEAHNLPMSLKSVEWADEIIVVDCESTDNTAEIARQYTPHVFHRENVRNLNINKQWGIDKTTSDWVFYLDADEVIPPEAKAELEQVMAANLEPNGYKMPRKTYYFGHWLKHGSRYPDRQLRFFRNGKARFPCKHVHEYIEVEGKIGSLKSDFDHFTSHSPFVDIRKMHFNSTFDAEKMVRDGKKPTLWLAFQYLFSKPWGRFFRRYLMRRGFLDGYPGLIMAMLGVVDFYFRWIKFWFFYHHPEKMEQKELQENDRIQ